MNNTLNQLQVLTDENVEKQLLIKNIKIIFEDIYANYPWIVAEVFIDLQNQSRVNQEFIDLTLSPLFHDTEQEKLMQLATECLPVEENRQRLAMTFFDGNMSPEKMHSAMSRDPLSLDKEQNPGCIPCDDASITATLSLGILGDSASKKFAAANNARHLDYHIKTLEDYRVLLKKKGDTFKDECHSLDGVLDTLSSRCV